MHCETSPFRTRGRKRARCLAGAGLFLLASLPQQAYALSFEKAVGNNLLYTEFSDPYYFSSGLYVSLLKGPLPTLGTIGEKAVYRHLASGLFRPNCILLEIGTYPLPLAGAGARAWAPTYYKRAVLWGTNIIRALTESINFKEPWSVSAFCGNTVFFKQKNGDIEGSGNIGLLCSYGYYHIKDNALYPDHWGEFEMKIKVDKSGAGRQYGISYRVGARLHGNREIKDYFYIGLNRDRTDFSEPSFSFYKNSNVQIRGDCSMRPVELLALTVEAGKKKPFKWNKRSYAVGLSLGATWNIKNAYSGKLGEGFAPNSITPIIRPLLKF
jgi:hypothetical protein